MPTPRKPQDHKAKASATARRQTARTGGRGEPESPPTPDQITIPEDLTGLSDEDLASLHDNAVAAFQALLPGDGSAPDDETLDSLSNLAEGIEALKAQVQERDSAALARSGKAKALADKVLDAGTTAEEVKAEEEGEDEAEEAEEETEEEPEAVVAGAKGEKARRASININLAGLRKDRPAKDEPPREDRRGGKIGLAAQGAAGFGVGQEMSVADMARSVNSRLGGFNASAYMNARKRGLRQHERFTISRLPREFDERAVVQDEDPKAAMKFAVDESRLEGNSLVASGGWCAPSETLYDLVDISEAANLDSTPEIQITRGGIRHTLGPDYRTVYEDTGFTYTEQEDVDGDYDGAGGGAKPCQTVPCPGFDEVRLGYGGVCIGAGLLQQRGYPEVIEDYITKALNAHAHKMSAAVINAKVADSDAVDFPGPQAGAVAPLLTAIDLQAAHYRAVNRMSDNASLEVELPTWIQVALRSDLARRLGVDLLDVSDARVRGWFTARNVNPQYVVDWQDIATTPASGFTSPPGDVSFLLYAAGTWVKGVTESITLENIYDSVLLGTNDYTALFTEDPFLVAKRNHDSRVVTVPIAATGATHGGVLIAGDGTSA
jgi:hypothetical protein